MYRSVQFLIYNNYYKMKLVKTRIFSLGICLFFVVSCINQQKKMLEDIQSLEMEVYKDTTGFNKTKAEEILKLYLSFEEQYPEHERSPEFLYKSAELENSLMNAQKAIELYNDFYVKYPANPKAPVCLFVQGFIYETQLNDLEMAKKMYSDFLEKYPNHELVNDARFSLDNLGKSVEDLIRQFEEKIAKKDSVVS